MHLNSVIHIITRKYNVSSFDYQLFAAGQQLFKIGGKNIMNRKVIFRKGLSLSLLLSLFFFAGSQAFAADTTVRVVDTVATALEYSPRLKLLESNQEAIGFELERAKGYYYPQVDVAFGYGIEAHSDISTRLQGTEHHFYDRMEASIRLSQLLYDGKETGSRVDIEEAKLISADHRVRDNAEAIALDAIIAHMEVYRQRSLLGLAQRNVKDHMDILEMLNERQEGGAGSIADVDQAHARLARAQASLNENTAELRAAEANYIRYVGKIAGDLEFFVVPSNLLPITLDEAIIQTTANNPKVLALSANIKEAESRVDLSRSNFLPKIHAELSSSYQDQVDSSETYEHNNQAMLRLRWNIFNGHHDTNDRKAAIARKSQAAANRDDQRDKVIEETRITWAELESARLQSLAYGDALSYNQKTLDSYRKQFNVGQRTLLDVLDARNEMFQSSGQLVTAKVNEVVAAERLLALTGKLIESVLPPEEEKAEPTQKQQEQPQ
jgi:adhesin transport system outer membrane protein